MTTAQLVDITCCIASFVGPIVIVIASPRWGVWLGAAYAWLLLIVAGELLSVLDPARVDALGDSIWFLFGWVATLAYSMLIAFVVRVVRALCSRRKSHRVQTM